jgi:hypothetical protein
MLNASGPLLWMVFTGKQVKQYLTYSTCKYRPREYRDMSEAIDILDKLVASSQRQNLENELPSQVKFIEWQFLRSIVIKWLLSECRNTNFTKILPPRLQKHFGGAWVSVNICNSTNAHVLILKVKLMCKVTYVFSQLPDNHKYECGWYLI